MPSNSILNIKKDGAWVEVPALKGEDGITPNLTIGTVETLPSGSNATASITGDTENPVLNLGIPKGADGVGGEGSTVIDDTTTTATDKTWSANKVYNYVNEQIGGALNGSY